MKKISVLFAFLLVAAVTFVGCKKDESEPVGPSISFQAGTGYVTGNTSVEPGDTVKFKWTATKGTTDADAKLATFTIKIEGAAAMDVANKTWNAVAVSNDETYVDEASFYVGSNTGTKVFSFVITDKDGMSKDLSVTITIETQSTGTPFTYTETGQFFHVKGAELGAYDLDGDAEVASSGAASAKSMKNTDANVTFTGSWTAETANGTTYVKANSYNYTSATVESSATAFASGSASATVTNPANNDIYIGKKGTSTYYVIKITALDPNGGTSATYKGKISFEYKKM